MAKQAKITIETDSILFLRGRAPLRAWCPECGDEVEMVPMDEVGVVSNLPASEVEAWFQSEGVHHTTMPNGEPSICLNSMLKRVQKADWKEEIR